MRKFFLFYLLTFCLQLHVAQAQFPAISQTSRPWTRWWWMGSAVDSTNISSQLASFKKAGLGGVEIVPIYGAIGYEPGYIKYLSPRWMKMLDYTVERSTTLKMGVYMSIGTGWPIGGPQVSTTDAATKLITQVYQVDASRDSTASILLSDTRQNENATLLSVTAYGPGGEVLLITDKVGPGGKLQWKPAAGIWQVYAAFAGKTRQLVKRAAPGGEGYTLDHFSPVALTNYLKSFDTAFGPSAHGVKAFYNDSYEVYNADWTPGFFDAFKNLRGYDLRLHLRELVSKVPVEITSRVKSDYRETVSDLMLKNFANTFTQWSHNKKALSLNQAHGSPGNLLDLYAAFDIPEAETFGSSAFKIPGIRRDSADIRNVDPDPIMLKFASSAAHAMGNKLASSETFTWLTEHFKTSWSQCKPEVEQAFLSGINHVFYHGTTYSPAKIEWPGWLFYASVNFVPANSLWPHLSGLNNYIARCQAVLQAGEPDNEILAYWPVYDAWSNPKGMDLSFKVHDIDEWLHPTPFYKNVKSLQENGFSVDFASDKMLAQLQVKNGQLKVSPRGASHKILLVSQAQYMPLASLQHIIRIAREGGTVILQQLPQDVPGMHNLTSNRSAMKTLLASLNFVKQTDAVQQCRLGAGKILLAPDVQKALTFAQIRGEALATAGLKFIRRSVPGGKYYFIVNHTGEEIDQRVSLNYHASLVMFSDPLSGNTGRVASKSGSNFTSFRLRLKSGESILVKLGQQAVSVPAWKFLDAAATPMVLANKWKLQFSTGGPSMPRDKFLDKPQPWTGILTDTAMQNFSGTGVYSTSFVLKEKTSTEYLLQIDKLYESARIIINGKDAGIIWSLPYQLRIGRYLHAGKNTISIEVCNLMANRIRYMDRHKMEWRRYHEINFVNINYKNFDAAAWQVQPSGLAGPVTIMPIK
jgi:hypothetical protein